MHTNEKLTTAYHFVCEGIIIYLLLLPISFYYYQDISHWFFVSTLIGIALSFAVLSTFNNSHVPYIVSSPILIFVFYTYGFPVTLSIIFTGILVWRYIVLRTKSFHRNDAEYIGAAFILTILGLIISRDFQILMFLLLEIIIVLLGFTFSHLLVIEKEKQRTFNRAVWLKWGGFSLFVLSVIYLLSDTLSILMGKVWGLFGGGMTFLVTGVAKFFEWLGISSFFQSGIDNMEPIEEVGTNEPEKTMLTDIEQQDGEFGTFVIIVIVLLLVLFFYLIRKAMRAKVKEKEENNISITYEDKELVNQRKFYKGFGEKRRNKPKHPIRKVVYDFEKKAAKLELGRMPYESIENWFERLGIEEELEVYQKVRYGGKGYSEEEEDRLRTILKGLEDKLLSLNEDSNA
ncbi:hypothetical protein [Ornithinibacillus scapharcae]|uniref:hypothetical protein n=1 Tax=Ornithinibacillus scapharcae TaxID=1147159 RepID=UPI000225B5D2|nr:hypothetical protein [Ornithinibacillus scapharcae]